MRSEHEQPKELIGKEVKRSGDWRCASYIIEGPFRKLAIIASNGYDWEHVSVSTSGRIPNWEEMSFVKKLFWDDEETVIQYHPSKSQYVNYHRGCLHMWRPAKLNIPLPPRWMVGPYPGWQNDLPADLREQYEKLERESVEN